MHPLHPPGYAYGGCSLQIIAYKSSLSFIKVKLAIAFKKRFHSLDVSLIHIILLILTSTVMGENENEDPFPHTPVTINNNKLFFSMVKANRSTLQPYGIQHTTTVCHTGQR